MAETNTLVVRTKDGKELLKLEFRASQDVDVTGKELYDANGLVVEGDKEALVKFMGWSSILMMKKLLVMEKT